jgi:AcrR family transcriptional regulator
MDPFCKTVLAACKSYLASVAKDTKERILDAALRLFARQGVTATTVVEIEREAGLSPGSGSFYRHYDNRDEVLRAVIDREVGRVEASRAVRAEPSSLEDEYLRALNQLDDLANLVDLLAREGPGRPEIVDPLRAVLAEGGTAAMAARIAGPDLGSDVDVEAVASVVLFALVGHHLAERFFGLPVGVDRERFAAALAGLVRGRS